MSLRYENGLPVISEWQLRAGHWPGRRLPPWQVMESEFHNLDQIALRQGTIRNDAQIMGFVEWFDERILVTFRAVEDRQTKGYYKYYAFPVDEDRWNRLNDDASS
jgi:hypothetical protein